METGSKKLEELLENMTLNTELPKGLSEENEAVMKSLEAEFKPVGKDENGNLIVQNTHGVRFVRHSRGFTRIISEAERQEIEEGLLNSAAVNDKIS